MQAERSTNSRWFGGGGGGGEGGGRVGGGGRRAGGAGASGAGCVRLARGSVRGDAAGGAVREVREIGVAVVSLRATRHLAAPGPGAVRTGDLGIFLSAIICCHAMVWSSA